MPSATKTRLPGNFVDKEGRLMGLFLDMPEADYHKVKAFSYSFSKEFSKSPEHGQAYLRKEWEIDPDREKYKAVHLLALEENPSRIIVRDGVWRGALKEEVLQLQKLGRIVLKADALEDARKISEKIRSHSLAGLILENSLCEVSIFFMWNGVYCKSRIDILSITEMGICLGDLKNFGDLSSEELMGYQIGKLKYNWQMAFYDEAIFSAFGTRPIKRYWIFVEDKDPHGVKVRNCTDAMVEAGRLVFESLLPKYKQCLEDDIWPGYAEDEADAGMPDRFFQVVGGIYD
jgi:hypothetical protein